MKAFFIYLNFCILFSYVFANSYPTISISENQINNGEIHVGKLLAGNINQYSVDFTNKLNINQFKVEIIFDINKNVIPCVTAYPHLSLLNNQINQNNCEQTHENGKYSILIENPQLSHWYIQIRGVGSELEELIEYSLTVSWEECHSNYWGNACEIEAQEVLLNTQEIITFSNDKKIISFEVTEDLQEISILFWEESAANLCAFYQFSSPLTNTADSSKGICFENSQKLANFIISPAPIGKHFLTFTTQPTSSLSSFSMLISSSECRREICTEEVVPIKGEASEITVPHNNDHFSTSFFVQEENQIFTFNLVLENYKNEEILFTIAPRSLVGLDEFNYLLSVGSDNSIAFQLIAPIQGEWIIFGEFISAPCSLISMSIDIHSINQAEGIIPVAIYATNQFSVDVPPRSWVYYQLIQQNKVSLAVDWELNENRMIIATQYDSLPSFTNFIKINQSNIMHIITKYDKSEYIGIYNANTERKSIEISSTSINAVKHAQQQQKKVDNFLGEPDGANFEKGADTRVYIFIWSTVIICGGILIICLIVLIVWTRKAIIKLKASGAYDALRGKEQS